MVVAVFEVWGREQDVAAVGQVTRHTSHVTRHTSHITRHTSHITRYCGLLCCGSVFGACAWGSYLQANSLWFQSNSAPLTSTLTSRQNYITTSLSWPFYASFYILYGLEFLCLVIPKLMLLGRLTHNAIRCVPPQDGGRVRTLSLTFRAVAAVVVLCGVVGLVALIVSCAYESQVSGLYVQAAAACDAQGNDTNSSLNFANLANTANNNCNRAQAVQNMSEALALLVISIAYCVLVAYSITL